MTPFMALHRVSVGPDGAFGVLLHLGVPFAVTLERTYEQPGEPVVKIPPGAFRCTATRFIRGQYDTYEINVLGHSRLLFHKGNYETDSDGCVLVGESFAEFDGKPGIAQSGAAFAEFIKRCANAPEFTLEVS